MSQVKKVVDKLHSETPELLSALFLRMKQFGGDNGPGDQLALACALDAAELDESEVEVGLDEQEDGESTIELARRLSRENDELRGQLKTAEVARDSWHKAYQEELDKGASEIERDSRSEVP